MISICIPYIRPQNMPELLKAIKANAGIPESEYEVVAEEDVERVGCPQMLKRLVAKSAGDTVCFIGDDTYPKPNFLRCAVDAMQQLPDGWGVVGLNSQASKHAAHFLADKRMLPLVGGEFFSTDYKHCWCDNELTDVAIDHGKFVFCVDAVLEHSHPIFNSAPVDDDYNRVYSKEYRDHDFRTYCRRKRERLGNPLGIGFPVIDQKVYLSFFLSFVTQTVPELGYRLLIPQFPTGEFIRDICIVRNNIVEQALFEGCSHLLMLDTDQVYRTPDMIPRMLAHGKRVVSAPVHRRYPPFDPILLRGSVGGFEHIPEEEAYSGDLIEVDSTGTGCVLYDVTVFEEVEKPWYEFGVNDRGEPVGEDIGFHSRLKDAGVRIYTDTSIEIGHLTIFEVNKAMHRLFKKAHGVK